MPDLFDNPIGFFGLLAIPAILAIHFLREKSRRVTVTTMFLLDRMEPRTPTGRRLRKLQNSIPLWMQLLIAVLATWLLVQPRWIRSDSRQRVTVILDPTASMQVARVQVLQQLPLVLRELSRGAARTDWLVMSADRPESPLYRGADFERLQDSLTSWQPAMPGVDPARAFSLSLLDSRGGPIIFVSDRKPESIPAGVTLLTFGRKVQNCGFAGLRTWREKSGIHWEALVKNSGNEPQEREWWMETGDAETPHARITLQPGEIMTLPGPFPAGAARVRIRLSADDFPLDDTLPIVAPEPKPLYVAFQAANTPAKFIERLLETIPGAHRVGDASIADVVLTSVDSAQPPSAEKAVIFFGGSSGTMTAAGSAITVERHPLTEGTLWKGLLSSGPAETALASEDQPLVWQRDKPLVFLRQLGTEPHLVFNFDFARSNAERLPATVLVISRFLEAVQQRKVAPFASNFETHQILPLPRSDGYELVREGSATVDSSHDAFVRAPLEPGFFAVRQSAKEVLSAAARFGDPREADFRDAETTSSGLDRTRLIPRENLEGDRFANLWLAMVGAAMVLGWAAQGRMQRNA